MPIHEYRDKNGKLHERIFLVGDEIPEAIATPFGVAHKVTSSPTIRFVGQFSGGTPKKHMKTQLPDGHEVLDDGGKRRMKELEKERKEKARAKTREFLADSLRTYDI
jgi:hypothetical protein